MACFWCRHFAGKRHTPGYGADDLAGADGVCTLWPTWAEVKGGHYCGQFLEDYLPDNGPDPLDWRQSRRIRNRLEREAWYDTQKDARKEVRRLKEANKALRAKLRAAREPT